MSDLPPLPRIPGNPCSDKQAKLIRRMAKTSVLDVPALVHRRGKERPEELSRAEASQTIEWVKEADRWAREWPEEFEVTGDAGDGPSRGGAGEVAHDVVLVEDRA